MRLSKPAVEQFASVLRIEMAPRGVDVGNAHMTWIDTDMVRDAQQDLSSFGRALSGLPGAFGVVTSLEISVDAFTHGCDMCARTVFVPDCWALRQLLISAFALHLMRGAMASMSSEADAAMHAVGRSSGKNSVRMGE